MKLKVKGALKCLFVLACILLTCACYDCDKDSTLKDMQESGVFSMSFDYPFALQHLQQKDVNPAIKWHLPLSEFEIESRNMPDDKYFHEHPIHNHLDARFTKVIHVENQTLLVEVMHLALDQFAQFSQQQQIPIWLAHGTLIGWYWGQKMLPWDSDMDLQTTMRGLDKLSKFNQTLLQNRFLIDVNPHYIDRRLLHPPQTLGGLWTSNNRIDARIVDTQTGFFVDLTGLSLDKDSVRSAKLFCKGDHFYSLHNISPLYKTSYEGILTYRPNQVAQVLASEYSETALLKTRFKGYSWDRRDLSWKYTGRKR
ncbi:LicD family-domain-containing protein [Gorgonomyces haynaldii]|nr:LicD family-domain-containing protein [Gorgonomyces haynaldii]